MKKQLSTVLVLFGLILTLVVNPGIVTYATSTDLGEVEIKEYQGEDLSSINAFRENSIKGPQYVNETTYRLAVTGLVDKELWLTYNQTINDFESYKKVVTLYCVEGWDATILWEGILIEDLIKAAQYDTNATTVIFYAHDGYSTSLPLNYILDNHLMIAYKMNNVTLPPERGYPFQLVAESKWGYKWIKWVVAIELSTNDEYRGFWETRGYSNNGDLEAPYFDSGNIGGNIGNSIPEFPTWMILPLFGVISLVAIIARKKYSHKLAKQ